MRILRPAGLAACWSAWPSRAALRPAELVPPVSEPVFIDPESAFPKIRFADGLVSVNDRCPVTKRKLSVHFPPVYVNGQPIGFC